MHCDKTVKWIAVILEWRLHFLIRARGHVRHRCKNVLYVFIFDVCHVFNVLTRFYSANVFRHAS